MKIIVVQFINKKAYKFLESMEELNLISILRELSKLSSIRGKVKTRMSNEKSDKRLKEMRTF